MLYQSWEFMKENKKVGNKERNFFFLSWSRACFLWIFYLFSWSLSWSKACFLYKFSPQRWEFIKENKKVRKQEKNRKHALDQESVQEKKTFLFSCLFSWSSSCFLSFVFFFSCFLTFLFSFINSHLSLLCVWSARTAVSRFCFILRQ